MTHFTDYWFITIVQRSKIFFLIPSNDSYFIWTARMSSQRKINI